MIGSAGVASWIAHGTFWTLLVYGWFWDELGTRAVFVFVTLWVVGLVGVPYVVGTNAPFSSFVAALDIALVFAIFKGDVRLR